jgi:phage terminase large subunit
MVEEKLKVDFPEKLMPLLFGTYRYKVAHGGRGSAKSWSFARALLMHGVNRPLRILCAREIQKSLADSVHQLLSDQVEMMGLQGFYDIQQTEINGKFNSTKFIFHGLSELTVDTIKSYEGIDIVWVEEGQSITERSWKILIPTIRKDGSEIWISFNPDLDSDPTYVRFVKTPAPDSIVVEMNWRDNPFWNDILEAERQDCLKRFPQDYDNVWEGKCRPAVEGAIFFEELSRMEKEHRVCNVPYDPMLKAHVVVDLGFNDEMAIAVVQRHVSEVRVIHYLEGTQRTLSSYSAELKELRLNWGKVWLPYADGFSKDYKTGKGSDEIFKALGWDVASKQEVSDLDIENGIKRCREVFPRVYVDQSNCAALIECWRRYRRHINKQTLTAGAPLHDRYSHGGDCTRYILTNVDSMTNDTGKKPMPRNVASYGPLDAAVGY